MYISKRVMFRGLSSSDSTKFDGIFQDDQVAVRFTIAVTAIAVVLVLALLGTTFL